VDSVNDPRFKTSFEDVYTHPSLQVPWYIIAGNRDHKGNVNAQIEYTNVSTRWHYPALYYTEVIPLPGTDITVQLVFIDTMMYLGKSPEAQDTWLEDTLQKSTADWLFVCGHHPVYSSGEHGPTARMIHHLRPLMEKYKVTAYFCGHDHALQHLQDGSGIEYFCSGAGYEASSIRYSGEALPHDVSKFFWPTQETAYGGFVSVEISGHHTMKVTCLDSDGQELYSFAKTNPMTRRQQLSVEPNNEPPRLP